MADKITKSLVDSGMHLSGSDEIKAKFKKAFEKIEKRKKRFNEVFKHVRINLFYHERAELESRFENDQMKLAELIKRWSWRLSRQKNLNNDYNKDVIFRLLQAQSLLEKRFLFECERVEMYGEDQRCQIHYEEMMSYYFNNINNLSLSVFNQLGEWGLKNHDLVVFQLGDTNTCVVRVPFFVAPIITHKNIIKNHLGIHNIPVKEPRTKMERFYHYLSKYQRYESQGILLS